MRDGNFYGSLIDVLNRGSIGMLLAIGMTLVVATGGVDLSVGSIVAIGGTLLSGGVGNLLVAATSRYNRWLQNSSRFTISNSLR